jgi:hypothetical protein
MSNENFRRELNAAFEQMSGAPSPTLANRVRSSIAQAPPAGSNFWIAGVAAAVMAIVIVSVLFVANPLRRPPATSGPTVTQPSPSPAASPSASASPSPSASPTASATPFVCASGAPINSSAAPTVSYIDALRTGTHSGYDRVTIEFMNGQPSEIDVQPQSGTTFTLSPRGDTVTLAGQNGILVTIHGADLHTSYSGGTDIKTGYATLVEVRSVQDFEGVVQLGLGINGPVCYRAFTLTNPSRLVIDVQAS